MARSSVAPVGELYPTPAAPARNPGFRKQNTPYGSQTRTDKPRKILIETIQRG